MKILLEKGIYFILLLGMIIPLAACQPFGNSDDDEGDKIEQEQEDQEGKENEGQEDENKSEKDD
jgi:hypothetical protein